MTFTLPNDYLSASSLNCLLQCPRQFEFKYVQGIPTLPTASMLTGTALHRTFEAYYKGVIANADNRLTPGQMADLATACLHETLTTNEHYTSDAEQEEAGNTVRDLAAAYAENVAGSIVPLAVEEEHVWLSRCGVPMLAYIDLRHQLPEGTDGIVDYKVTTKRWTPDKLTNSLQFSLYSMMTGIRHVEVHNLVKTATAKRTTTKPLDGVTDIAPNLRILRHAFDGSGKSRAEQMLANWLRYMGVEYEYEKKYPHETSDEHHRQYTPDFYIPAADLYIELWAIGDNDPEPEKFPGYKAGMKWKRELHHNYGTKLAEVTAREVWTGDAFEKLKKLFASLGLRLLPGSNINQKREDFGDGDTKSLVMTFMAHVKNGRLTKEDLEARCRQHDCGLRGRVFLELFWKFYDAWQERLRTDNCVDFDDMTGMAVDIVQSGKWKSPYKLVMADEFQDTSAARADLLNALTASRGHHLFVVGDDWQGINRFAGSDLSVMTHFEEKFGEAAVMKLETTFRFPQTMCDIMGGFVLKNKSQLQKKVRSVAIPVTKPVILYSIRQSMVLTVHKVLDEISREGKASVLILGRYKHDREIVPEFIPPRLTVNFLTVHAAKGREADYVIIPNVNDARLGFPSQVEDDPLLDMCSPEAEPYLFAEERRLFYVAVTRARKRAYVIGESGRLSPFITELAQDDELPVIADDGKELRFCPECKKGLLRRMNGRYGPFWGCSRYPDCRYTKSIVEVNGNDALHAP